MCFYLHCQVVAAQGVGDLAHVPEVTREMGTSPPLMEHKSGGISCPGAPVLPISAGITGGCYENQ